MLVVPIRHDCHSRVWYAIVTAPKPQHLQSLWRAVARCVRLNLEIIFVPLMWKFDSGIEKFDLNLITTISR